MAAPKQTMALTPELVALCRREEKEYPDQWRAWTRFSEEEHAALARQLVAEAGGEPIWIFAYGSLLWQPDFDVAEKRRATALGWHRSFCMKMTNWRATPAAPGLMMALARGGRCDGAIYRLAEEDAEAQLLRILRRELWYKEHRAMVRWIPVIAAGERLRALVFWAGPKGENIALKLPLEEVARLQARACGYAGSCAEYLYNTVSHLEEMGIRDRNLWRLQALVAAEIKRIHAVS